MGRRLGTTTRTSFREGERAARDEPTRAALAHHPPEPGGFRRAKATAYNSAHHPRREGHAHSCAASSPPTAHTATQHSSGTGSPATAHTPAVTPAAIQPDAQYGHDSRSASHCGTHRALYTGVSPSGPVQPPTSLCRTHSIGGKVSST